MVAAFMQLQGRVGYLLAGFRA